MEVKISNEINVYKSVKEVLSGGHILAVYGECDRIYAENSMKELVRDYRITKKVFPSKTECTESIVEELSGVSEDVRLILVYGGDALIDAARVASTMLGIGCVIIQTTAMRMVDGSAYVFRDNRLEVRQVTDPKVHLLDSSLIMRKGNIEHLIGDMAEMLLSSYDALFAGTVTCGTLYSHDSVDGIIDTMNKVTEDDKVGILSLAYSIGLNRPHIMSEICHEIAYHSEESHDSRTYKFGMAYMLLMMYRAYLKYDGDDLLYPPDIVESARVLAKRYGMNISALVLGYKVMGSNEYMRMSHIASEYKVELIDILDRCLVAMKRVSRVYRRVSRDAGYRLNESIRLEDMTRAVSIFSICEDMNTPLRIMKTGGFLEKYIAI